MNDLSDNDALKRLQASIDEKALLVAQIEQSLSNLDTTMNFKVNSLLKAEFDKLCNLIQILVVKLNFLCFALFVRGVFNRSDSGVQSNV